jgi:hypothetical protein
LHAPSYVCFETPLPGTAHFYRLARQPDPALLPNAATAKPSQARFHPRARQGARRWQVDVRRSAGHSIVT